MRLIPRAWAFVLAPVLFGVAQPTTCSTPPICQATGTGTCYYADDLPGRGGRGTFADPFRLGDFPSSASDCDDRGGLPRSLRPGDVFYFRAGSYGFNLCANEVDGAFFKPLVSARGDGTLRAPIVFRSYPGERATLIRRSGIAPLAGSYDDDHVRFIGLDLRYPRVSPDDDQLGARGRHLFVVLGASHVAIAYNTIELFDHPKSSGATDNHDAIYLDNADFTYIGHNRIRGPGNPANPVPAQNCSGYKGYRARFSVVEDNWFEAVANPIFDKEEGVDNTFRRNLTTGSGYASFNANGNDLPRWSRARIHDNVFDAGILVTFLTDGFEVYRNDVKHSSLFNAGGAAGYRRIYRSVLFDNIVRASGAAVVLTGSRSGQTWQERNQVLSYLDHNCYVGSGISPLYKFAGGNDYDTRDLAGMRLAGFENSSRAVPSQAGCGAGRFGGPVGPTHPALVSSTGRYGQGNASVYACSDGIDQDGDWLVDFPADPDCRSSVGTSEGAGTSDVAPQILSLGGPYVSRNGAPVALAVTVSDPDSVERVSWRVENWGSCKWNVQSFVPTQLVEDPQMAGLPAVDGACRARVSVYDYRGRAASALVPITLQAD